jgi:hypothetical protein
MTDASRISAGAACWAPSRAPEGACRAGDESHGRSKEIAVEEGAHFPAASWTQAQDEKRPTNRGMAMELHGEDLQLFDYLPLVQNERILEPKMAAFLESADALTHRDFFGRRLSGLTHQTFVSRPSSGRARQTVL